MSCIMSQEREFTSQPDACEMRTPHEHEVMVKTLSNPIRRQIIRQIGNGIKKDALKSKLGLDSATLKFQLDYLVAECYITVEDGMCRLTEKGKDLDRSF